MADWQVINGDCVEAMAAMDADSIDAIVTDPPYGLEFMGRAWDKLGVETPKGDVRQPGDATFQQVNNAYGNAGVRYGSGASYGSDPAKVGQAMQAWHERWAREALRVLKPGGYLLAFGGTRTYHRLACAVEDVGFEIRDRILVVTGGDAEWESHPTELAWMYGSGFP